MKSLQLTSKTLVMIGFLALAGCSHFETDPTYSDKNHDDLYKNGSLASEKGGLNILGDSTKRAENTGIGVNAFLWRATLDVVAFMPVLSADPFGGVILTDWYSSQENPNERTKLNLYIRDRDLRADGIKASVFRQVRLADGSWADATVAASTATGIENAILTRARVIRIAQKQTQQ